MRAEPLLDMVVDPTPPERKPLNGFERTIQVIAFMVAGLGVLCMLGYLFLLWWGGHGPTTKVDTALSGTVGDFIGGVAGSLFALSATLLFYLALTLQRREFKNSLKELQISSSALKATEEHHRSTLQVMREEKEFNVCHTATMALMQEVENWKNLSQKGLEGIKQVTRGWRDMVDPKHIERNMYAGSTALKEEVRIASLLDGSDSILQLHIRVNWLVRSIITKELSPVDRQYLNSYALPLYHSVHDASDVNLQRAIVSIEQYLPLTDEALSTKGLSRTVLQACHKRFTELRSAWSVDITATTGASAG